MADKHSLNYEVRELKLGASFTNNKASQYHTIKYDFKPASVDVNKMATVDVGTNNQVTVTVPHLDGAGVPQTVFKGNQRPYAKECVLIIDRVTGEITLEKLSSNIQVKKTRQETSQKARPLTPVTSEFTNTTARMSSRTRVTTNKRTNNNNNNAGTGSTSQPSAPPRFNGSSSQKPPQSMVRSPPRQKTSPPQAPWSAGGNSTLASLPMIGLDDALAPPQDRQHAALQPIERQPAALQPIERQQPAPLPPLLPTLPTLSQPSHHTQHNGYSGSASRQPERNAYVPERSHNSNERQNNTSLPVVNHPAEGDESSSSSSSDSGSDSGSDSDSDDDNSAANQNTAGTTNGTSGHAPLLSDVLNDDLCLSESGSDSD